MVHEIVVEVVRAFTVTLAGVALALLLLTACDGVQAASNRAWRAAVGSSKLTVQVAVAPAPDKVQGDPLIVPATPPATSVTATVPVGVTAVPAAEVSVTVAVQVEA